MLTDELARKTRQDLLSLADTQKIVGYHRGVTEDLKLHVQAEILHLQHFNCCNVNLNDKNIYLSYARNASFQYGILLSLTIMLLHDAMHEF